MFFLSVQKDDINLLTVPHAAKFMYISQTLWIDLHNTYLLQNILKCNDFHFPNIWCSHIVYDS